VVREARRLPHWLDSRDSAGRFAQAESAAERRSKLIVGSVPRRFVVARGDLGVDGTSFGLVISGIPMARWAVNLGLLNETVWFLLLRRRKLPVCGTTETPLSASDRGEATVNWLIRGKSEAWPIAGGPLRGDCPIEDIELRMELLLPSASMDRRESSWMSTDATLPSIRKSLACRTFGRPEVDTLREPHGVIVADCNCIKSTLLSTVCPGLRIGVMGLRGSKSVA